MRLIPARATSNVAEDRVRSVEICHPVLRVRARDNVGVVPAGQRAIGRVDRAGIGAARNTQDCVRVELVDRHRGSGERIPGSPLA
jgi:molybdate-binding protein